MRRRDRIKKALDLAVTYGGIDGAHHKTWVIDQMVRALTGCPDRHTNVPTAPVRWPADGQGESEEYVALVEEACEGEDGPKTYAWDTGIVP